MKVLIDGFAAASDRTTGWERYARCLISEFEQDSRGLDVEILRPRPGLQRTQWEQFELPRLAKKAGKVLMHFPAAPPSPAIRRPTLTTVHDATLLFHPEWASRAGYWYYRHVHRHLLRGRNRWILTISDASKNDLLLGGADPARLFVTKCGVVSESQPAADRAVPAAIATRLAGRPYVLFVGTLEPRKNMQSLLGAWRRAAMSDLALVVVGRHGWGASAEIPEGVIDVGRVSDSTLANLYANACTLVMPSLYEGFGLPVIEALAAGLSVVASDIPAHREVAGDAALFFPPLNEGALAAAIQQAVSMGDHRRSQLAAKGRARAEQFQWSQFGDQTARVYEDILEML